MEYNVFVRIFESIPTSGVLVPIFICSILLLAVFIERMFFFSGMKKNYRPLLSEVEAAIKDNQFVEKHDNLPGRNNPLESMLYDISGNWRSRTDKKQILSFYANRTLSSVERYAVVVSTIATISPMLGLLGTVTGMMKSFGALSEITDRAHAALAYGITEALITTILGLIVAIPAVVLYNYMVSKATYYSSEIENIINTLAAAAGEAEEVDS